MMATCGRLRLRAGLFVGSRGHMMPLPATALHHLEGKVDSLLGGSIPNRLGIVIGLVFDTVETPARIIVATKEIQGLLTWLVFGTSRGPYWSRTERERLHQWWEGGGL